MSDGTSDGERLTRIETKLDIALVQWSQGFQDHETRLRVIEDKKEDPAVQDHESRIRRLEERKWPLQSLVAVVGLIALAISIWSLVAGI